MLITLSIQFCVYSIMRMIEQVRLRQLKLVVVHRGP